MRLKACVEGDEEIIEFTIDTGADISVINEEQGRSVKGELCVLLVDGTH